MPTINDIEPFEGELVLRYLQFSKQIPILSLAEVFKLYDLEPEYCKVLDEYIKQEKATPEKE